MTISIGYGAEKVLGLLCREIIEGTVLATLDYGGCSCETEVNVILADNGAIWEINREHRQIDALTDVLSSLVVGYESPSDSDCVEEAMEDYFNPETGELVLGDIVISADKVEEQVEKYGHSQTGELAFLTVYSTPHLFGYNHMGDSERLVMGEKQREILETRGYTR